MKLATMIMVITFALCTGVCLGGEKGVPQKDTESVALKVLASSKTVIYDNAYDEKVTRENTAKNRNTRSEKTPNYSTVEINTEVIQ